MTGSRRFRLTCVDVAQETPEIATFVFKATDGALPPFRAGQFLTLDLPRAGHPNTQRSFTIASPPSRPDRLAVTVRAGAATGATFEMRQAVRAGVTLGTEGPFGAFCLREPPEHPLVLISAGSGATPMLSMARWLFDLRSPVPLHYIHIARGADRHLRRAEMEMMARDMPNWSLDWLATGEPSQRNAPDAALGSRPAAAYWAEMFADVKPNAKIYCCGPAAFMEMVGSAYLKGRDCEANFFTEAFHIPQLEADLVATVPSGAPTIAFIRSGRTVAVRQGATVLEMALSTGVVMASSCRLGLCGTCRVKCLSGTVEMTHQGGILDEDVADGYILACCSRPLGDLAIDA